LRAEEADAARLVEHFVRKDRGEVPRGRDRRRATRIRIALAIAAGDDERRDPKASSPRSAASASRSTT